MAEGILIQPEDSSRQIALTSNVRVPMFCGMMRIVPNQRYNVPGYVPGSQVIVLVDSFGTMNINLGMMGKPPNGWTYQPLAISRINVSGGQFWADYAPNSLEMKIVEYEGQQFGGVNVMIFQVLPATTANFGLHITDSTNLLEVSNVGSTLRPVWRGVINFNGQWNLPDLGLDKNKYVVFGHWNNTGVGIARNMGLFNGFGAAGGLGICCGQANIDGAYNGLGVNASVSMEVVIFYPVAPEPSHSGISIWNAQGQCTWSTKFTPFIMRGTISLSKGWSGAVPGVQRAMIPLTSGGFYYGGPNSRYKQYGIMSNGNQYTVTPITSGYTTKGSPGFDSVNASVLPVIDAADYM